MRVQARLSFDPVSLHTHMALRATIFKASLQIADMDRGYYADHALTLARHPSETDERMMIRLFAFARHASQALAFGKGLSNVDEPDLAERDLTGAITLWIEVGQPDERAILKACGKAERVVVVAYGSTVTLWWGAIAASLKRARNLTVWQVEVEESRALGALARRNMALQVTIDDGHTWIADGATTVELAPKTLAVPDAGRR